MICSGWALTIINSNGLLELTTGVQAEDQDGRACEAEGDVDRIDLIVLVWWVHKVGRHAIGRRRGGDLVEVDRRHDGRGLSLRVRERAGPDQKRRLQRTLAVASLLILLVHGALLQFALARARRNGLVRMQAGATTERPFSPASYSLRSPGN